MRAHDLERELVRTGFISDAPQRARLAYLSITDDVDFSDLMSRHPGLRSARKQDRRPFEKDSKFIAATLRRGIVEGSIRSLKEFSTTRVGARIYQETNERGRPLLGLLKRWVSITRLLPQERFAPRVSRSINETEGQFNHRWAANIGDEVRRLRILGERIDRLGDLWKRSGGGLSSRFVSELAARYPNLPERRNARRAICISAGLLAPLATWKGFTLEDVVAELRRLDVNSLSVLRLSHWNIYKWLWRRGAMAEVCLELGFQSAWRNQFGLRGFKSSFEAITAAVLHLLGLEFETERRISPDRAFRSDFFVLGRHIECYQFAVGSTRRDQRAVGYLARRVNEKAPIYSQLSKPEIALETERYWDSQDWAGFARYASQLLSQEFGLGRSLDEDQLAAAINIHQAFPDLSAEEFVDLTSAAIGESSRSVLARLCKFFGGIAERERSDALKSLRRSEAAFRLLLSTLTFAKTGITVRRMRGRRVVSKHFGYKACGGFLHALHEAIKHRHSLPLAKRAGWGTCVPRARQARGGGEVVVA